MKALVNESILNYLPTTEQASPCKCSFYLQAAQLKAYLLVGGLRLVSVCRFQLNWVHRFTWVKKSKQIQFPLFEWDLRFKKSKYNVSLIKLALSRLFEVWDVVAKSTFGEHFTRKSKMGLLKVKNCIMKKFCTVNNKRSEIVKKQLHLKLNGVGGTLVSIIPLLISF